MNAHTRRTPSSAITDQLLFDQMQEAWQVTWTRYFDERTHLFYDRLSSHTPHRYLTHLPTPEEISRQYPNRNGWGTGMEDCAISAGVIMSMICDRFAVTADAEMQQSAHQVFTGMILLGTLSPSPGFVIRGVCPADCESHYIESSIDQYTWYTYGLWRFFRSPLSTPGQRASIREILAAICERLERNVTPANDYHLGREDGTFDGMYDKLWEVLPHEIARWPMVYAVGADLTGEQYWRDRCRQLSEEAAEASLHAPESTAIPYALLQAQVSFEPLLELTADPQLTKRWATAMRAVAEAVEPVLEQCLNYQPLDLDQINTDWRTWSQRPYGDAGEAVPQPPEPLRNEGRWLRQPAEAALAQLLCPEGERSPRQTRLLRQMLAQVDYTRTSDYGLFYAQAAYWRAVRLEVLSLPA